MSAKFFCLAMPIGNAQDISLRGKNILEQTDVIAAEDTRKLFDWLRRMNIKTQARVLSYHSHNEQNSANGILQLLQAGKDVVLVSDAGTPHISDPGFQLLRLAQENNIHVIPLPGASALTTLLSISPLPSEPLLFLGFLSPKSGRRKNTLLKYKDFEGTVAVYESVHRVVSLMQDILEVYQNPQVFIGRELTKEHEETFWGTAQEAVVWLQDKKGEFSLLIKKESF